MDQLPVVFGLRQLPHVQRFRPAVNSRQTIEKGLIRLSKKPIGEQCPNGHAANSEGNCFEPSCPYHVSKRHDGHGH
jgi:hypothetical protein